MYNNIQQRNRDLVAAIKRELKKSSVSLGEAIERVVAGPAPRYYVAFDTAVENYYRMNAGKRVGGRRMAQWAEIKEKTDALVARGEYLLTAITAVLEQGPASSFFIGRRTAMSAWQEARRWERELKHTF